MKQLPIVEIKKPCTKNWNAMTLRSEGRFCGVCQSTVVDFTNKSPDEKGTRTMGSVRMLDEKTDPVETIK